MEVFQDANRITDSSFWYELGRSRDVRNHVRNCIEGLGAGIVGLLDIPKVGDQIFKHLTPNCRGDVSAQVPFIITPFFSA